MLLECKRVTSGYGTTAVLDEINFSIGEGEIVTLVGANGAGKSTLVKTISGLIRPMSGDVFYDGTNINARSTSERLKLGICHVPEGRQVFAGMTVAENLGMGAYLSTSSQKSQVAETYDGLLAHYPFLRERLGEVVGNFSGGQQQILAIARGLMSRPRLIMLDEPSLGLSPLMIIEVFNLVKDLRDRGISVLLSEQNAYAALAIADRGYVIENGRVAMSGPASELLESPEISEKYLGVGAVSQFNRAKIAKLSKQLIDCIAD